MKRLIKFIAVILNILILVGCSSTGLTMNEKIEDFNILYDDLSQNYPYIWVNERMNDVNFLENKEFYLDMVKNTENDKEFENVIEYIVNDLNNDHTRLFNPETYKLYLEVYEGIDKNSWYKHNYDSLKNRKVQERYRKEDIEDNNTKKEERTIEKFSYKDVIDGEVGYIKLPSFLVRESINSELEDVYRYLKEAKEYKTLILDIRGNGGGDTTQWARLLSLIVEKEYTDNNYVLYREGSVLKLLEYYLGEMRTVDKLDLENIPEEVFGNFKKFDELKYEVLPSEKSIKFKGNIYLLVDESVYSSSEAMAVFVKGSGLGTLIGEKTGGDGIGSDPIINFLPNSGILYQYTKELGLTSDGKINEEEKTIPHYIIDNVKQTKDFQNDECIKKVLEIENFK